MDLPVFGGTIRSRTGIKDSDIKTRAKKWYNFLGLGDGVNQKPNPKLNISIAPISLIECSQSSARVREFVKLLPFDCILPIPAMRVTKLYHELLSDRLLVDQMQPLKLGLIQDQQIATFLKVVDTLDELQILVETWENTRHSMPKSDRFVTIVKNTNTICTCSS